MSCLPIQYVVGQKVRLTSVSFERARSSNRHCKTAGYPSDEFLGKLERFIGVQGTVTHTFPPGYEVTVSFDGQLFHMKDSWIEPDPPHYDLLLITNPHDPGVCEYVAGDLVSVYNRPYVRTRRLDHYPMRDQDTALFMQLQDQHRKTETGNRYYRIYRMADPLVTWEDPRTRERFPKYAIVYPDFSKVEDVSREGRMYGMFRVVNLWTSDESSLYTMDQCRDIVEHALKGELRGSFDQ